MAEVQYAGEYELQTCEIIAASGVGAEISNNIVEIKELLNIGLDSAFMWRMSKWRSLVNSDKTEIYSI